MRHVESFAQGGHGDVDAILREADGWARTLAGAMGELAEERLVGADPSGVVRAEVAGHGRLRGLSIDPRGLRDMDHVQVAQAVQEAIVAAHLAMGERLSEVVQDLTGKAPGDADTELPADPLDGYIRDVLRGE